MNNLTPKQAIFVREYLKTHNATQSAITAGYSVTTAHVAGYRLLKHVAISAEIAKADAKVIAKHDVSLDRVVEEYKRIAFVDPKEFFDDKGNLLPVNEMSEDARRAIAGIDVDVTGKHVLKKLRSNSKVAALEALGRHVGMFPSEKQQINVGLGLEIHMHLDEVK